MIEFVLALGMILLVLGTAVSFILWALVQWCDAKKYRFLVRLKNALPPDSLRATYNTGSGKQRWKIEWRYKGKTVEYVTEAETEGEAVKKFISAGQGQGFSSIVNVTKL